VYSKCLSCMYGGFQLIWFCQLHKETFKENPIQSQRNMFPLYFLQGCLPMENSRLMEERFWMHIV
jgi:hypothetical protein